MLMISFFFALAGGGPEVQEANVQEFKRASDSPAVSWSVWTAPKPGKTRQESGHEQKGVSSFQPY